MADSGEHTHSGDSVHLSELRIVLLGHRYAGKSSSGNTILGREEFDLRTDAQCVKRQGEVAGRQITVVDTPGWWENFPVEDSPELVKQEIVRSVSLCPPGPHTLLLVIDGDSSFTEKHRRAVEGHLKLLSETAWHHTIVLFNYGDCLGDTSIEQHIASEGKDLQWLVVKCGNRYHVLNNKNQDDVTQVTELLDKIEEMVAGNRGDHYEMKREILEKMEERHWKKEERVKQRQMKVQEQRETLRSLMGDSLHLSELRIVLLGWRSGGKSSSGNTILGREEFDLRTAAQCVKRQGEVAGRQITVVDTPGWWKNWLIEDTPELIKQEIVLSVSLCPPGPHTLLLVIEGDTSFSEKHRRAVEEHLKLLSDRVWCHTIVLFTHGDCLGDTSIEQHIESEGKDLQWLVEKCGNRYHVLNNKNRDDVTQVTELLDKTEEMVAGNRGDHYEMKREIPEKIEEKQRAEKERATQRQMKVQEQRETLRSLMGDSPHLSELRIVLLGYKYSGKSSSGNSILGREEFDLRTDAQCVKRQGEVAGRKITVVDTPGWWKNLPVEFTPELVKQEIVRSVSLCPPGPHTFLLVIRGDSSFSEEHRRAVEGHMKLLSETAWRHTIVLFTYGDCLGDTSIEQHIESEGKDLQWLVEKCGNRYHVLNEKRGDVTQVTELLKKIEEMVAGDSFPENSHKRHCLSRLKKKITRQEPPIKRAESNYCLPQTMSEDDRSETSSRSREDRAKMKMLMTPVKKARSYELIPSTMSDDDRSDSWTQRSALQRPTSSTQSSAYGSLSSIAWSETSSTSIEDRDRLKMSMTPVKRAGSLDLLPPVMSEDDTRSLRISASQRSTSSTQSSAYGSLSPTWSETSSPSIEDRDRMKMSMTPVKLTGSLDLLPPVMSEDDRSETSSRSIEDRAKMMSVTPVERAGSLDLLPPVMSGDTSSVTQSLRSSAYGSVTSLPAPGCLISETKEGSRGKPGESQDAAESGAAPISRE